MLDKTYLLKRLSIYSDRSSEYQEEIREQINKEMREAIPTLLQRIEELEEELQAWKDEQERYLEERRWRDD